jgi:hypothetical protein
VEAGVKAVDNFGDSFMDGLAEFFKQTGRFIDDGVLTSRFGAIVGRKIVDVFANLDEASVAYFQTLSPGALSFAITDVGFIAARGVDPAHIRKVLSFQDLYGGIMTRADMLADLQIIAREEVKNMEKLVESMAKAVPGNDGFVGKIYEATSLAKLLRQNVVTDVEVVQKFVRANADGTGRVLTDIDFIGKVGGQ